MEEQGVTKDGAQTRATRSLLVLRAGGRLFAVYAEEAAGVAEAAEPVPLPHAPAAVLGVVSVRGRMYTLLDTAALLAGQDANALAGRDPNAPEGPSAESRTATPRFAVALGGEEQLALAADEVEGPLELDAEADATHASAPRPAPLRATLRRGDAPLHLLDPARLFDAAMQGTERRRQRS